MTDYGFHIHGKPYSQDIWKGDSYADYLNGIYSNAYLNASADESFMVIEILDNTVHYTYMRSKGLRDNADREGSYFAITVSIKGQYCSVIALYQLLDQIYNKIAKTAFFSDSACAGCIKYKVVQLADANAAEQMRDAFENNVVHLGFRILPTVKDTLRSSQTLTFSLMDVDSPEFVDKMMNSRIVVSPRLRSAVARCLAAEGENQTLKRAQSALKASNDELQATVASLSKQNSDLTDKLNSQAISPDGRYRATQKRLQDDLVTVTRERDILKQKVEEATDSVGYVPGQQSKWRGWLNTALIGIVLIISMFVFVKVMELNSYAECIYLSTYKPEVAKGQPSKGIENEAAIAQDTLVLEPYVVDDTEHVYSKPSSKKKVKK